MSPERSSLEASRARLKAALETTRREVEEELGVVPGAGLLLPLLAGAAGLALSWLVVRHLAGRRRPVRERGEPEVERGTELI